MSEAGSDSETSVKRVTLRGGKKGESHSADIMADGSLVIEWYDYSEDAENHFGNYIAYQLIIAAADRPAAAAALQTQASAAPPDGNSDADDRLLSALQERFNDYFQVQTWLKANSLPFAKKFIPWA